MGKTTRNEKVQKQRVRRNENKRESTLKKKKGAEFFFFFLTEKGNENRKLQWKKN